MQIPQFIPQGATRENLFKDSMVSYYFLFAKAVPTAMFIYCMINYLPTNAFHLLLTTPLGVAGL
jgi:hypothetical protein